jgi:hypothetical protein
MKNDLYNLSATAKKTGLPTKWLKKQAENGAIPFLRISPSRMLFSIEAVQKAINHLAAKGGDDEQYRP